MRAASSVEGDASPEGCVWVVCGCGFEVKQVRPVSYRVRIEPGKRSRVARVQWVYTTRGRGSGAVQSRGHASVSAGPPGLTGTSYRLRARDLRGGGLGGVQQQELAHPRYGGGRTLLGDLLHLVYSKDWRSTKEGIVTHQTIYVMNGPKRMHRMVGPQP